MPTGKSSKKKTQQNKSSTQVAATQSVYDVTVRDCLVWPDNNKKQPSTTGQQDNVVYVSLRQQQQQQRCRSDTDVCERRAPASTEEDDGTVSDALRGWPRYTRMCEEKVDNDDDDDDAVKKPPTTKTKTSQKTGKSKSKSNVVMEPDKDIHVADLISQRFLHEYMQQREAEMERDRKKKEAREKAAREGRRAAKDRTDIKANKAAQLRAIALADRVEASPFDLWKMEKFTRSARPHVSTFRNGQRPTASGAGDGRKGRQGGGRRDAGAGYSGGGGDGGLSGRSSGGYEEEELSELVGACTCPDRLPYYDGRDVYSTYDDRCVTTDVNNFDNGANYVYSYVDTSSPVISAL